MVTINLTGQKDRIALLRGKYTDSKTFRREAKANPYSKTLTIQTGLRGRSGQYYGEDRYKTKTVENPYYISPEQAQRNAVASAEKANASFKASQEEVFKSQQADIAKQLKIVQGEKSAVSKMMADYSNMLIAEAQRKKEAEEQAARDLQTQRANQAMAGRSGSLQIQPAGSTPRTAGTQQFRRRAVQFGGGTPYTGLSQISSGMVNV